AQSSTLSTSRCFRRGSKFNRNHGVSFHAASTVPGNRGIGLGDSKLILSVTALLGWWGWGAAFGTVFMGFLGAGLVGVVLLVSGRVRHGAHIPMGPFFIAGAVVILAVTARAAPG
ncbi:hypothetical protein ABZS36_29820, partial [Micromonospora arida]